MPNLRTAEHMNALAAAKSYGQGKRPMKPSNHAYIRVSTDQQGLSVEAQGERVERYCEHKGIELDKTFVDKDISGGKPFVSRPSGMRLNESLEKGDNVIVVRLDRTFRDIVDGLTMIREWAKHGVTLHIVDSCMAVDISESDGFLSIGIQLLVAEAERMKTGERIKAVHKSMKEKGCRITRADRLPYGYKIDPKSELHPVSKKPTKTKLCRTEQKVISIMSKLRQDGLSLRNIGIELEAMGYPPRGGKYWHPDTIKKILDRKKYTAAEGASVNS